MLIQNSDDEYGMISRFTYDQFFSQRENIKRNDVALLIESLGGYPDAAYKLAKLFYNRAGGFTALVPGYAKSAATLICLGANQIILGEGGELGPLDMQTKNQDDEEMSSALNHVQTLERLRAFSLTTLDETVQLMLLRTNKKVSSILPLAMEFSADMVRPLMESIDVVRYTEMSRLLKIGEDYALRLLKLNYSKKDSERIADKLVSEYAQHDFIIDVDEAKSLQLSAIRADDQITEGYEMIFPYLNSLTVIGTLTEETHEE